MRHEWGPEFLEHISIGGDSVGAIFAIGLGLKYTPEEMDIFYRRTSEYGIIHGPHKACVILEDVIREMLVDPNAYKILKGRIFLGTTEFLSRHRWHLSWNSNEDLIECIKGSFHIPFYCQRNKPLKNINVLDGAYSFSGTDLPHGNNSLFIGIDPHAEITRTFTNSEMFFPPDSKTFEEMKLSGSEAFRLWLTHKKMIIKVGNRHPNYQALYVLWILKAIDLISVYIYSFLKYLLLLALFNTYRGIVHV